MTLKAALRPISTVKQRLTFSSRLTKEEALTFVATNAIILDETIKPAD